MLGNIFARNMNDIPTAMTYFEQALSVKPDDHIAINNIGANLMQLGRMREAEQYFQKAYTLNPNYAQTLYALAMVNNVKNDYVIALDFISQAAKNCRPSDPLYNHTFELANEVSGKAVGKTDPMEMYNEFSQKLAVASGKNIDLIEDENIPTPAKIEIAENYNRDKHIIRYKKGRQAGRQGIPHLLMHELGHLHLTVQGRKKGTNYLFVATKEQKELFIRNNETTIVRLNKKGLDDESLSGFITSLFNGMNSQIYNVPIDLFIEDFLYKDYPPLRPFQFISLLELLKEYIAVSKNRAIAENTPIFIRTATIILSLVNAHQFKDLYGFDLSNQFEVTSQQLKISKELYSEYLKYQKNDRALDAHELIRQWAKRLGIEGYFSLIEETEFRASKMDGAGEEPDHFINPELQSPKTQIDFAKEPAGQSAVTMYMLAALQYFNGMPPAKIKEIGFEIGLLGQKGIDHANMEQRYYLKSIPDKEFTGLQILSYMYVAFHFIDPTLDMGLNFKKEFETAKGLFESGKK
jgi:tetratricopeptide (TPR) repeat protein